MRWTMMVGFCVVLSGAVYAQEGGSWGHQETDETWDEGSEETWDEGSEEVDPLQQMLEQSQRDAAEAQRKADEAVAHLITQAEAIQKKPTHENWGSYWTDQVPRMNELITEIERLPVDDFNRMGYLIELEITVNQWMLYGHLDPNAPETQQLMQAQSQMQEMNHRTNMGIINNMGDGSTKTIVTDPSGNVVDEY